MLSQFLEMDLEKVKGIALFYENDFSHLAVLAQAKKIPIIYMQDRKPIFVILRIVLILIFSINSGHFELNPYVDAILNRNKLTKFISLFFLTLSLVVTINESVSYKDIFIALAARVDDKVLVLKLFKIVCVFYTCSLILFGLSK